MKEEGEGSGDFIKWFSELDKESISIVGGKGANLSEIYNLKIPVPPGFVVTTKAYDLFLERAKIKEKISEILEKINYENTKNIDSFTKEIRDLITDAEMPKEIEEEIIESYNHLNSDSESVKSKHAEEILNDDSEEESLVIVRSSATTEDLEDSSFAGQQDTFSNVKGGEEVVENVKKAFASLFTSRATYYRNKKGFKHTEAKLAVVVQKMINSEKSGVIFSKDPSYEKDNLIIEAVFGMGEGIVSGSINPDKYLVKRSDDFEILNVRVSDKKVAITRNKDRKNVEVKLPDSTSKAQVLSKYEIQKLSELALKIEEHYGKAQDIEFAIEGEEIYIVQTRAITTIGTRVNEGKEIKGESILEGIGGSPGIASGKIKIIKDLKDLDKIKEGDVLVTGMTNPDMVVVMQKASAIVTDKGGMTSHAAIVSREIGVPSVIGTNDATLKLKEGEIITVNGFTGKIYKGKVAETVKKEILPVEANTKTKIKVTIDLPEFAERAAKTKLNHVGLLRIEGIIAESGKHPGFFLKNKKFEDYEKVIYKGVKKIAEHFDNIWVRTSDVRSDEFHNLEGAPEKIELNPMLGMHGIRYSLKHPEILKAELRALKKLTQEGKKIGIMFPQIISVDDIKKIKEICKEIEFERPYLGVMIETPASVQMIREICEEGIKFISFGTNDLTQYTLAIDRGNEKVQEIYDEMNPAVLKQIKHVIRVCKKNKIKTSICGQAANRKEMVEFLVQRKIDSISVNPDSAKEISDYVKELENKENL